MVLELVKPARAAQRSPLGFDAQVPPFFRDLLCSLLQGRAAARPIVFLPTIACGRRRVTYPLLEQPIPPLGLNGLPSRSSVLSDHVSHSKQHHRVQGEVEMWGDGKQTRSFTFIDDCVEGILRITKSDFKEPLNLGSTEMVSMNEMMDMVFGFGDSAKGIKHIPGPEGVRGRNSDNALILEKLGWEPTVTLKDGLQVCSPPSTCPPVKRLLAEASLLACPALPPFPSTVLEPRWAWPRLTMEVAEVSSRMQISLCFSWLHCAGRSAHRLHSPRPSHG